MQLERCHQTSDKNSTYQVSFRLRYNRPGPGPCVLEVLGCLSLAPASRTERVWVCDRSPLVGGLLDGDYSSRENRCRSVLNCLQDQYIFELIQDSAYLLSFTLSAVTVATESVSLLQGPPECSGILAGFSTRLAFELNSVIPS